MRQVNIAGRMINLVSGFKNLGELSELLKPFSYRVLKEDCLDLPPKIYIICTEIIKIILLNIVNYLS